MFVGISARVRACVCVRAQLCPTRKPMDYGPPGSSVHGIFQARVLEWGAIAFSIHTLGKVIYFSKHFCQGDTRDSREWPCSICNNRTLHIGTHHQMGIVLKSHV